jgi:hypothetical protein
MQGAKGGPHQFAGVLIAPTLDPGLHKIAQIRSQFDDAILHETLLSMFITAFPNKVFNFGLMV